jgi:hypothetical protein
MRITRRQLLGAGVAVGAGVVLFPDRAAAAQTILGCDAWGSRPPTEPVQLLATKPVKIIVHHTATANSTDLSLEHAKAFARSVQNAHFGRGWIDTGQQFTISRGAHVLEGRHRSLEALTGGTRHLLGAHCTAQNAYAVGIENEGTYTSVQMPAAQYAALVELCTTICRNYGIRSYQLYGHRDFQNTACPGNTFYPELARLRRDVAARVGGDPTHPVWPVLRRGSTGEAVRTLQLLLRRAGVTVTADGEYGPATETAVRAFQTERGSGVDGLAGRQTWNHLADPCRSGDTGDAVTAVQRQLSARGIATTVDGLYGSGTAASVRTFQTRSGLPSDGAVDARTWSRLVG